MDTFLDTNFLWSGILNDLDLHQYRQTLATWPLTLPYVTKLWSWTWPEHLSLYRQSRVPTRPPLWHPYGHLVFALPKEPKLCTALCRTMWISSMAVNFKSLDLYRSFKVLTFSDWFYLETLKCLMYVIFAKKWCAEVADIIRTSASLNNYQCYAAYLFKYPHYQLCGMHLIEKVAPKYYKLLSR